MGLIASLPDIDRKKDAVFVMHEKSEKLIPLHTHTKGQLSYVEGGVAYITAGARTYIVPARHYFWIPRGMPHVLRVGYKATVLRSLYFYAGDDDRHPYYSKLGIYPATELVIQMINYTERWDEKHVTRKDPDFCFLAALKNILPQQQDAALTIILPETDNEEMQGIVKYLERNVGQKITLAQLSRRFNISERSLARLFQACLHISFLQFLKTMRMIRAIELIIKTRKPMNEIASLVGYATLSSFSDAFQQFTHSRPLDFRKSREG
jgi:AraC-like DNA-binding protein